MQALGSGEQLQPLPDVFDVAEAAATQLFVDPWACGNVSPLEWELLQQVCASTKFDTTSAASWH